MPDASCLFGVYLLAEYTGGLRVTQTALPDFPSVLSGSPPAPPTVAENIARLVPYRPGKPVEEVERELGITGIIKLASNENSLGPSPKAMAAMQQIASKMHIYPDA